MLKVLNINFNPSANGWSIPIMPANTGPCLLWIPANNFLSHSVKKEIAKSMMNTKTKLVKKFDSKNISF